MLETRSATIRCRCGGSFRVSGEFIGAPACPHCRHRMPAEDLAAIEQHVTRISDRCNHAGQSRARLYGVALCCGCGRPALPLMPTPEDLIMSSAAAFHLNTIRVDRINGVDVWTHRFPGGRWLCAFPLLSPSMDHTERRGCIQVGRDDPRDLLEPSRVADVWEFPRWSHALQVFVAWDGHGEPVGWDRHPATHRFRPNGIEKEKSDVIAPRPEGGRVADGNGF